MRVNNINLALFLALLLALIIETNAQAELSNPTNYDISQFWPGGFSAKITIGKNKNKLLCKSQLADNPSVS